MVCFFFLTRNTRIPSKNIFVCFKSGSARGRRRGEKIKEELRDWGGPLEMGKEALRDPRDGR